MNEAADLTELLGPALAGALDKKGYTQLTAVQRAVLDPALAGRDLRISSQTGSGKTLAIGLALRETLATPATVEGSRSATPRALVLAPTRELAKQVAQELRWLYAGMNINVATATGGSSFRDESRGFAMKPAVIVGTPGRMLDCLKRDAIDASQVGAVVLDEADRMLDLGFREDLEAILACPPKNHRTHLVSATFAREVGALADRVQTKPAHVEGTRLGTANADIDHVIHLVASDQRLDAMVNILLGDPEAQTLVFVRMRVDVAQVSRALRAAGFTAAGLSGEMEQRERNQTLSDFKRGQLRVLVATDVAARGIDLPEVTRVIHAEPPTSADAYTHRSGRTGRAGRKGLSALLVTLGELVPATRVLRQANIKARYLPVPTAAQIRAQNDARIVAELTAPTDPEAQTDPRLLELAQQLLSTAQPEQAIARLLARLPESQRQSPRDVTPILPPDGNERRPGRNPRDRAPAPPSRQPQRGPRSAQPARGPRPVAAAPRTRGTQQVSDARESRDVGGRRPPIRAPRPDGQDWVPFVVTWGQEHGADARRLLAMVCRRGNIRSADVGAIAVQRRMSMIQVRADLADGFARAAALPDPRDPRVRIRPETVSGD